MQLFNPIPSLLLSPEQTRLSDWFVSDERKLLERVIRSRIAESMSIFSDAVANRGAEYLGGGELTVEQKNRLKESSRLAICLEVLQQLADEANQKEESGQPPFTILSHIDILHTL